MMFNLRVSHLFRSSCLIIGSLCLLGCDSETSETSEMTSATCSQPDVGCFDQSWELMSDNYMLTMQVATPSLPERGENTWVIAIEDMLTDESAVDCTLLVTPFMPEHNHGAPMAPIVTELSDGEYEINQIVFSMPGLWEMRFEVSCGSEETDHLVYAFWLDA
jgi:hypothetical protein